MGFFENKRHDVTRIVSFRPLAATFFSALSGLAPLTTYSRMVNERITERL